MLHKYKTVLTHLLQRLIDLEADRVGNRLIALEIQLKILKKIIVAEKFIRCLRQINKGIQRRLSDRSNTKVQAAQLKTLRQRIADRIEQQMYLLWVYRNIGDSVAFIYGDRWDLKQYTLKQDAGFISGKTGLELEVQILKAAYERGGTVILNDLTNTMRHMDITLFRADLWPDGGSPCLFVEAKSGKGGNKARAERQKRAVRDITSYLFKDTKQVEGGSFHRVSPDTAAVYYGKFAAQMVMELRTSQWLLRSPEVGLQYLAVSSECSAEDIDASIAAANLKGAKTLMLDVNAFKRENWGYYPYPLSFQNPGATFSFYNGEFVFLVFVDLDHINETLRQFELQIEVRKSSEYPWKLIYTGKDEQVREVTSFIGSYPIGRLASEFVSLDWLIRQNIAGPGFELMKNVLFEQSAAGT
jgi:hypothetical protein